eukprot:SAG31_NODE_4209_length_3471_cov_1.290629_1_plen_401_part_00
MQPVPVPLDGGSPAERLLRVCPCQLQAVRDACGAGAGRRAAIRYDGAFGAEYSDLVDQQNSSAAYKWMAGCNNHGSASMTEVEVPICRICFSSHDGQDDDDELLTPCNCTGSQRFIHRKCLRRWQCSILRSHNETPSRMMEDERHKICNVCKSAYSVPPPTREELLAQDLGADITDPIGPAALLVSRQGRTDLPAGLPFMLQAMLLIKQAHWRQSVYLIIDEIPAHENEHPTAGGAVAGTADENSARAGLPAGPAADGSAAVHAVNITRWLYEPGDIPPAIGELIPAAADAGVEMRFHNGGPVKPKNLLATTLVSVNLLAGCPWKNVVQTLSPFQRNSTEDGNEGRMWVLALGPIDPILEIAKLRSGSAAACDNIQAGGATNGATDSTSSGDDRPAIVDM